MLNHLDVLVGESTNEKTFEEDFDFEDMQEYIDNLQNFITVCDMTLCSDLVRVLIADSENPLEGNINPLNSLFKFVIYQIINSGKDRDFFQFQKIGY